MQHLLQAVEHNKESKMKRVLIAAAMAVSIAQGAVAGNKWGASTVNEWEGEWSTPFKNDNEVWVTSVSIKQGKAIVALQLSMNPSNDCKATSAVTIMSKSKGADDDSVGGGIFKLAVDDESPWSSDDALVTTRYVDGFLMMSWETTVDDDYLAEIATGHTARAQVAIGPGETPSPLVEFPLAGSTRAINNLLSYCDGDGDGWEI